MIPGKFHSATGPTRYFKKLSSAERISFLVRPLGAPFIKLPSARRAEMLSIQNVSDEMHGRRKLTFLVSAFAAI
jgi:hypothetical protein